ncbi:MAG: hypothetical protein ACRDA4_10530 [Filifactoraceae bacterium]
MEVTVLGKDTFKIIRLINKLGIKKEIGAIFKKAIKMNNDAEILRMKIKVALGDKEYIERNVEGLFTTNPNLAEENQKIQESNLDLIQEVIFLVLEGVDRAEKETYEVLSSVYKKSSKELQETPFSEFVDMIKGVIMCEEFQKVFTNIFK